MLGGPNQKIPGFGTSASLTEIIVELLAVPRRVKQILDDGSAMLDMNHPLAGKEWVFVLVV